LIDGKSIGLSPARAAVVAGKHSYSVMRGGVSLYDGTVKVESGGIKLVRVPLSVGEATGIVTVKTIPSGATVLADGNRIESQTPTSFRLTSGRHTLVISFSGFRPVQRVIEVKANEPVEVDEELPRH
jgi:hypothetical protein